MQRPRILGGKRRPPHRFGAQQVATPELEQTVQQLHVKTADWQERVFKYASIVPEVQKGSKFVYNVMDRVTFEIERFDRATNKWVPEDAPEVNAVERKINLNFKAGRAAQLGHLVEECYVLVNRTPANDFRFETLAPGELKRSGKKIEKRVMVNGEKDDWACLDDDTTIIRIYTPDPQDRNKASGPHKPLLNLLETMALELLADQRNAVSLLAGNGILLIPSEVLPDEVDTNDNSDTPGTRANFENTLQDAMLLPITDGDRGEAVVPVTLYGPAEHLAQVRHIVPNRGETAYEVGARMDRYAQRYARNVDLPEQVILGVQDSNHWNVWMVDANTWAYHLEPRAQQIADAIYRGVVREVMINLGRDPDQHRLVPNPAAVIAKADLSANAATAYKVGALKGEAYMEAAGFDTSDLRDDAEELLLLQFAGNEQAVDTVLTQTMPQDRTAASSNPVVVLRQAARAANQHQARLEAIMRSFLDRVARAAAADGKRNAKRRDELTAETGQRVAAGIDGMPFLGYEPGKYFEAYGPELERATLRELGSYLRRIATLSGVEYSTLRRVWEAQFEQRAQAMSQQARKFADDLGKASFDRGTPARVLNAHVRTMTSIANGGEAQAVTGAKNTARPTHAGEDPVLSDTLADGGVVEGFATQYRWVVGDPMRPFEPHQELDGTTWFSWEEFDTLEVNATDEWLPGTVYFPGDHDGCQCSYEIDFVPLSEAT